MTNIGFVYFDRLLRQQGYVPSAKRSIFGVAVYYEYVHSVRRMFVTVDYSKAHFIFSAFDGVIELRCGPCSPLSREHFLKMEDLFWQSYSRLT